MDVFSIAGYGNLGPKSREGQLASIIFTSFGLPLLLLFLSRTGRFLANGFRCFYRACCGCSSGDPVDPPPTSSSNSLHHTHHSTTHHPHDHYHIHHIALNEPTTPGAGSGDHVALHCGNSIKPMTNAYGWHPSSCFTTTSGCNAVTTNHQDQYGLVPLACTEAETKLCAGLGLVEGQAQHTCGVTANATGGLGTLNRLNHHSHHHHHPHHHHADHINPSSTGVAAGGGTSMATNPVGGGGENGSSYGQGGSRSQKANISIPVTLCLLIMQAYIALGACVLYFVEHWPVMDAIFFCYFSVFTVGFGNLMPAHSVLKGSPKKLVLLSVYLIGGLAVMAMCYDLVHEQVFRRVRNCGRYLQVGRKARRKENEQAALLLAHQQQLQHQQQQAQQPLGAIQPVTGNAIDQMGVGMGEDFDV